VVKDRSQIFSEHLFREIYTFSHKNLRSGHKTADERRFLKIMAKNTAVSLQAVFKQ
jgi:hypothetical protein